MLMFVKCFTVTMPSSIYKLAITQLSNNFGKNIPHFSPYGEKWGMFL